MAPATSRESSAPAAPRAHIPYLHARRGYLLVLLAAVCWSASGTFIKFILANYAFSAWTIAFWRDVFTFAPFLLITLVRSKEHLRVARRDLLALAVMGALGIGIFHVLWALAVTMTPVAVATVLNYTAPFFVILYAWALWREKPTRRQVAALMLAFVGCLLVTGAYDVTNANLNWLGLLVGLSTGATYALVSIVGKASLERYDPWTVLTYAFGFAALTLFILQPGAVWASLGLPLGAWVSLALLSLISTVTGFALYTNGLKYLSAGSASITATLEPVFATVLAFVVLDEMIAPIQLLGGAVVISAVILLAAKTGNHVVSAANPNA